MLLQAQSLGKLHTLTNALMGKIMVFLAQSSLCMILLKLSRLKPLLCYQVLAMFDYHCKILVGKFYQSTLVRWLDILGISYQDVLGHLSQDQLS